MAKFIGTKKEYTDFIGPRIRNIVNIIATPEKRECNKKCRMCGEENIELEAAHKHGKERKVIINKVLDKYLRGHIVEIDIKDIENEIKKAHCPIKETFIFVW